VQSTRENEHEKQKIINTQNLSTPPLQRLLRVDWIKKSRTKKNKNAAPCRTPQRQGANSYRTKNLRTKTDKNAAEKAKKIRQNIERSPCRTPNGRG
jgi:hypothetical protein